MYLAIESDVVLDCRSVVGIFDLDKTTVFKINRNYLSNMEKRGKIKSTIEKLPKAFIVCKNGEEESVYISRFLPATLLKRDSI